MRSSRSKRTDLHVLADVDQSPPHTSESVKSHVGGFSSFFGRSKNMKSASPITTPECDTADAGGTPKNSRRNSLASKHYRAMSRSMNDLGGLVSRAETPELSLTRTNLSSTKVSPAASPSKKSSAVLTESLPFPADTISKQGWLNKRGSKKEASMKLHRVFV